MLHPRKELTKASKTLTSEVPCQNADIIRACNASRLRASRTIGVTRETSMKRRSLIDANDLVTKAEALIIKKVKAVEAEPEAEPVA